MRAKHDLTCASRKQAKCNCEMGKLRQIKKIAIASMKRRAKRDFECEWLGRFFEDEEKCKR